MVSKEKFSKVQKILN
ncbi:MAG: hypothetical protein ACTHWZ_07190 [Peptoniphilaceae bacterium]